MSATLKTAEQNTESAFLENNHVYFSEMVFF